MEPFNKLFKLRESLRECEEHLGIADYSDIERAVLEFIVNQEQTTIAKILKHQYFDKYSLSTINRVVAKLLKSGVIKSEQSESDKREMNLSFAIEN